MGRLPFNAAHRSRAPGRCVFPAGPLGPFGDSLKLLTYERPGRGERTALLVDDRVVDLADTDPAIPTHMRTLLALGEPGLEMVREARDEAGPGLSLDEVTLRPPVMPGRFLDFYAFEEHVKTARGKRGLDVVPEWYEVPAYYNGNHRAMLASGEPVRFPSGETRRDYELELAAVIGRKVPGDDADAIRQGIVGYSILNDWSARAQQAVYMKIGLGPSRSKDFATSLGPVIVVPDAEDPLDPADLRMRARVNGETWSDNNSSTMHHGFEALVRFAAEAHTLLPGDVLGSGTVGGGCGLEQDRFLEPGDQVELEVDGIGVLANPVAS